MNPLYEQLSQNLPGNQIAGLLQRFNEFRANFQGNPKERIMELMRQGVISPQQYNNTVMLAQQLQKIPAFGAQDVSINRTGGQSIR